MNKPEALDTLAQRLRLTPYQAYSYSYPHKSAYRKLPAPQSLAALWGGEDRSALFGYIHVPFCSMRCGFCNLFAMARPEPALVDRYVAQVVRQMRVMDEQLGKRRFARFAIGGGTPTYLSAAQLGQLFDGIQGILGVDLHNVPSGIEASPETVSAEKLAVCRDAGVSRVSLGIQSFSSAEMRALVRLQQNSVVRTAIERIREAAFPVLNLDLIYGIAGQTKASLLASIDSALSFAPEEIYLYPLYIREQTGLGRIKRRHDDGSRDYLHLIPETDTRLDLYTAARDHLRAAGYTQTSMRMFRAPHAPDQGGPVYCCQNDGMVGLGAGARSYTRALHYSSEYAIGRSDTRHIIDNYVALDDAHFAQAWHGFQLDAEDQRRRFVIQSILTEPGLRYADYLQRFGSHCLEDLPQLNELFALQLVVDDGSGIRLNDEGYAHADTIGPWLVSAKVRSLMEATEAAC
ncbi:STM4012 family radical SAM protein [Viridibacterium curvum]|uniref:STM4012 family radical SAM protein n=1 Tax=Viridibacterium curvum TaxID=1101404 RepID=A0ABP9QSS6_9RHOO